MAENDFVMDTPVTYPVDPEAADDLAAPAPADPTTVDQQRHVGMTFTQQELTFKPDDLNQLFLNIANRLAQEARDI